MGGGGGTIEADETFFGTKPGANRHARGGYAHKNAIFSLVERGAKVRSFHVPNVTANTLKPILQSQMATDAHLMTDDGRQYLKLGPISASHETVAHTKGEYVRGNVHTNTVEGYFSLLKRGLIGTYHHVGEQHLQRYGNDICPCPKGQRISSQEWIGIAHLFPFVLPFPFLGCGGAFNILRSASSNGI
jgi:hypothetical protein